MSESVIEQCQRLIKETERLLGSTNPKLAREIAKELEAKIEQEKTK